MSPDQVIRVRDSFERVAPIADQAAALFYGHLFAADPSLRPMFRGDMTAQGTRLMEMIASAVALLDRPDSLLPVLRSLGARHAQYGVREAHYASVGAALLLTLEQGLAEAFTAETREAWEVLYALVSRTMQEGTLG